MRRRAIATFVTGWIVGRPLAVFGATTPQPKLPKTPADFEGPFYPVGPRQPTSNLISGEPRDEVLHLTGRVLTETGSEVPGALVDIWQTDPLGRYDHPRDSSRGKRWDDFLYWGEAVAGADGGFAFRTYVPGAYAARPSPHIHFKVWVDRKPVLTSQIYFAHVGGPAGRARNRRAAERQTVEVVRRTDGLAAGIDIVI